MPICGNHKLDKFNRSLFQVTLHEAPLAICAEGRGGGVHALARNVMQQLGEYLPGQHAEVLSTSTWTGVTGMCCLGKHNAQSAWNYKIGFLEDSA